MSSALPAPTRSGIAPVILLTTSLALHRLAVLVCIKFQPAGILSKHSYSNLLPAADLYTQCSTLAVTSERREGRSSKPDSLDMIRRDVIILLCRRTAGRRSCRLRSGCRRCAPSGRPSPRSSASSC